MSTFTGDSRIGTELIYPGRKPSGKVKIDWNNPLARGLEQCIITNDNAIVNLVNRAIIDAPDAVLGADKSIEVLTTDESVDTTSPCFPSLTCIVDMTYKNNAAVANSGLFGCLDGGAAGFEVAIKTATNRLWWASQADFVINYTGDIIADNQRSEYVFVHNENSGGKVFLDGMETANSANTGALASTDNLQFFNRGDSNPGFYARAILHRAFYYSRALSDMEIYSINRDPYQFLVPDIGA